MTSRIAQLATPVLTVTGGLFLGEAIRLAIHHGHAWPLFAGIGAAAWTVTAAALWLPYLAERRRLLRRRALLLRVRDEIPAMVAKAMEADKAAGTTGEGS